jgi:aerobic carbon-monoxide dehydrogenase small subunit
MQTCIKVNGKAYDTEVETRLLLVDFLRDSLGLTGTKVGCDTGQCGVCTVLIDGLSVKSCTVLAVQADSSEIVTIEGVAETGQLSLLQAAFWEKHGLQCGFCTPAMILSLTDLLQHHPDPSEVEIRSWLDGILCRCTGYHNVVRAVKHTAEKLQQISMSDSLEKEKVYEGGN